jgi:hypothetical protein
VKFYLADPSKTYTIPAGKCWATPPTSTAQSYSFDFPTAVKGIVEVIESKNKSRYDLNGIMIDAPRSGQLYIQDGKTYVKINDYQKLRHLFGELLAEVQRIKSTGDYEAARRLIEDYGVKVDPVLHQEVLERYKKLDLAPYKGFVNPKYELVKDADGNVTDVKVTYDESYVEQMLRYSKDYRTL